MWEVGAWARKSSGGGGRAAARFGWAGAGRAGEMGRVRVSGVGRGGRCEWREGVDGAGRVFVVLGERVSQTAPSLGGETRVAVQRSHRSTLCHSVRMAHVGGVLHCRWTCRP